MKASILIYMGGTLTFASGSALAEPWSIEPRLGASAEFASNPALSEVDPSSEQHIAALVNLPLRYDADGVEFLLAPNGRLSNSRGYSSLASSYLHVDANAQFSNDLGATTLQAELARDSSLYHAGGLADGVGVRSDTALTSADWTRLLTERSRLQLDLSWSHVNYAVATDASALTDYRYATAGPTFQFDWSERDTFKFLGNLGRYQSLNGFTESKSENLQIGYVRQLTELWSLSTTAGYSRSTNTESDYAGPQLLGRFSSDQTGAVYMASLAHKGRQLTFVVGASRALQPTGFAYLSLQDTFSLTATYMRSERWDFGLSTVWNDIRNPLPITLQSGVDAASSEVHYFDAQITANWHWTPLWILSLHAIRITQQYGPPRVSAGSSGVSVDLVRQFLRHDL